MAETGNNNRAEAVWKDSSDNVKYCGYCTGMTVGAAFTTALVFLGYYAYNNPDPTQCWVVRDLHSAWPTKADAIARADTMDIDITSGYPMEMHAVFEVWFMWGFWTKITLIVLLLLGFGVYKSGKENAAKIMGFLSFGLYAAQGIVWLGLGAVWRYSKAGQVAAGDELARRTGISDELWAQQVEAAKLSNGYQVSSGRFMNIYLMLMTLVVIFTIIGFIVGCLYLAFCDPVKKERREQANNRDGD